jgi:hypothetical protein
VWGQIHDFTPEEEEKLLHKGRLIAVVSRIGEDLGAVGVVEEGREILGRLHELYYGSLASGLGTLSEIRETVEKLGEEFPEVEVEVVVVLGEFVYIVVLGGGGIWVKTEKGEGWLVNTGVKDAVVGLSGKMNEDKVLVMGNKKWWDRVTLEQVRMVIGEDMEKGVELLAAAVHGEDVAGGEVGAIVKFQFTNNNDPNFDEATLGKQTIDKSQNTKIPEKIKKPKIWEKIKLPKINIKKKEGPVYVVHEDRGKKRKRTRYVAAGFAVVLLLIGLGGRFKIQNQNKQVDENNKLVEDMMYKFREAKGVAELNPSRSKQLLPLVQQDLQTLEERKVTDSRIAEVRSEFGEVLGLATGTKKVQLSEVMDLGLVRDGMVGNGLGLSEGKLIVADKTANRIAIIDPDKKSGKVVAGADGVGEIKWVAGYPGKATILSDRGIIDCSLLTTTCSVKISKDTGWGEIADIKMFAGNVYLLDTGNGDIYRYQGNGDAYGNKKSWLADDVARSAIKFAKKLAIDGNVWVVGGDGVLLKFSLGVKEDITVSGWDKPWGANVLIYTDENAEKLYILDRDNSRLMMIKKTGEYEMQLVSDKFSNVEDMVIDEVNKKAYLVGGGKLWEADW